MNSIKIFCFIALTAAAAVIQEAESKVDSCTEYGYNYENGETWFRFPCRTCSCNDGKIMCTRVKCEEKVCEHGVEENIMDACCPVCREVGSIKF